LKKAVLKDPTILKKDTVVVTDTFVTQPVVMRDTVTLRQHDTITIQKDKLRVSIVKRLDTLIIEGRCDSDTIVKTIEVPVDVVRYVEKESFIDKIKNYIFYILLIIVLFPVLRRMLEKWLD
jgi:hypothetical protein